MIVTVKIQRIGDKIEAQIESPRYNNDSGIPLDSIPVFQVFENNNEYVFISMFVLDEQEAIKYLVRKSPIDIFLKSPGHTEVISIGAGTNP